MPWACPEPANRPTADRMADLPAAPESESAAERIAEFSLIERLMRVIPVQGAGVACSIGDDAAILSPTAGRELVVATDTLNEGIHFLPGADPQALGHKALAVNLSDIAAMGARPRWALLSLSLPVADKNWVDGFASGFAQLAKQHGVTLVGGDTCSGPLSVTVVMLGDVPAGEALRRDTAEAGDLVYVSGMLGDAALALRERLAGCPATAELDQALDCPGPQLELGRRLRGLASACIDLSDGLLADLGHLVRASGLGAELQLDQLPASPHLGALSDAERWALQLAGGDDYGLCFSIPESGSTVMQDISRDLGVKLTQVGRLVPGTRVKCLNAEQEEWAPPTQGWEHFSTQQEHPDHG